MESKQKTTSFDEDRLSFEQQKEKIRAIVGNIGGRPTKKNKIINGVFVLVVVSSFAMALFTSGLFRAASIESGLLLLSLN